MISTSRQVSNFGRSSNVGVVRQTKRPSTKDGEKEAIWIPMLNSASKGKDLAEKQLLVLGGTPEQQREFLEQLNPPNQKPRYGNDRRKPITAPVSNRYALGYTYHDVLDADQEDVLARLNIYMLANPSASFAPLLKPLFTAKTVKDTLITILLDWSDPFKWARQLRQWVRLLRSMILSLDEETKIEMEENMTAWKEKRVGPDASSSQPGAGATEHRHSQVMPLGLGEWDEGLGIPISVVCVQAEKIESLERELGWQEDQFDFLMQWLRTVLLKHGGSLVYTASFDPNNVRTLIHSNLSIHSLLKRDIAKHNVIDRDKILVPSNWDSWGKIRILKEGFDPESIGNAWSIEIQDAPESNPDFTTSSPEPSPDSSTSAVSTYESTLPNPLTTRRNPFPNPSDTTNEIASVTPVQEFLKSQHTILENLKAEDEKASAATSNTRRSGTRKPGAAVPISSSGVTQGTEIDEKEGKGLANARMAEHIGPYQINVNGIDFDAEEATRRLRERENERNNSAADKVSGVVSTGGSGFNTPTATTMKRSESASGDTGTGAGTGTPSGTNKSSNEAMSAFFANLIKKDKRGGAGGVGSNSVSPTRAGGSPAPERRGAD